MLTTVKAARSYISTEGLHDYSDSDRNCEQVLFFILSHRVGLEIRSGGATWGGVVISRE